jgi:hypothetical protein
MSRSPTLRPTLTAALTALSLLALPMAAPAPAVAAGQAAMEQDALWVDVIGHAVAKNSKDKPAARRRALADALIAAGMAGGVQMKSHTVMDKGRIMRDFTMMRAAGSVLRYDRAGEHWNGNTVEVHLRALVAPLHGTACGSRRNIVLVAMAPEIYTSPHAPAWSTQLGAELYNDAMREVGRTGNVTVKHVMGMGQTPVSPRKNTSFDYNALTRGHIHTHPGDTQLTARFEVDTDVRTTGEHLVMRASLELVEGTGHRSERVLTNSVRLPGTGPFTSLADRKRHRLKAKLAQGFTESLANLMDVATCTPVAAHVSRSGKTLSVSVGRAQGLSRSALAFTENPAADFEALEIVKLSNNSATLRPVDPSTPLSVFEGRIVRFVDAGK